MSRRILISGGTSGIGLAVASRLAATDRVWVLGSAESSLAKLPGDLPLAGVGTCDVADPEAVRRCVDRAADELGGLDGAFVNAGIDGLAVPAIDLDIEHFRRVLDVNVLGAFSVARAVIGRLRGPGTIVCNASVNALRPEADFLDYNVSKAAVVAMVKSLALELSGRGVTVIALCPGYFPTPMTQAYLDDPVLGPELLRSIPAGRFGDLTEIGEVVDFLLSPAARFMTGAVITLDGGRNL